MEDLDAIAGRLQHRLRQQAPARPAQGPPPRQAAVAIVLHDRPLAAASGHPQLLFIRRSHKPGDPWSGQMAFPGGHLDPTDEDLRAAAIRETAEEIGLDLTEARYLGEIEHVQAAPRGHRINLLVHPHVFLVTEVGALRLNYEVAEVVSASLPMLMSNDLHHVETYDFSGEPVPYNGYRLPEGHFVWGLTYRMLKTFFSVLDASWQPPPEQL